MFICLCGAARCNTPEARAIRDRVEREREAERQLNREAFALYLADREHGRRLETPVWYREEVIAVRTRAVNAEPDQAMKAA